MLVASFIEILSALNEEYRISVNRQTTNDRTYDQKHNASAALLAERHQILYNKTTVVQI